MHRAGSVIINYQLSIEPTPMQDTEIDMTEIINHLAKLQAQLGESDQRFATHRLNTSGSSWTRLKNGNYGAKDHTAMHEKLTAGLAALQEYLTSRALKGVKTLIPFSTVKGVLAGIRNASADDRNRLVIYLAPTGGGKTKLANLLLENYTSRAVLVEASEPWRESYLAAILALCAALGMREVKASTREAEASLLEELRQHPKHIIIDEAHYFGQRTLNLVKLILNKTDSVVILLAIPLLWDRVQRAAGSEVEQLRTRTAASIRADRLSSRDLVDFLVDRLPTIGSLGDGSAAALSAIQDSCNSFGLWDTAERIAAQIRADAGDGDITMDIVKQAIRNVETLRK